MRIKRDSGLFTIMTVHGNGEDVTMKEEKESRESEEKIVIHADSEIGDLIPGFLENRQKDIEAINEALESGDHETIRLLGHSMKGAGAGYGFDEISTIGRAIEAAAKTGDGNIIRSELIRLETYLKKVEVIYE